MDTIQNNTLCKPFGLQGYTGKEQVQKKYISLKFSYLENIPQLNFDGFGSLCRHIPLSFERLKTATQVAINQLDKTFSRSPETCNKLTIKVLGDSKSLPIKQEISDSSSQPREAQATQPKPSIGRRFLQTMSSSPILDVQGDLAFTISAGKGLADTVQKRSDPLAMSSLGIFTSTGLLSGAATVYNAHEEHKEASRHQDTTTKTLSCMQMLQGLGTAGYGASFTASSSTSLACSDTTNKAALKSMEVLGSLGTSFSILSAITGGIPAGYSFIKGLKLKYEMSQIPSNEKLEDYFKNLTTLNLEESISIQNVDESLSTQFTTILSEPEQKAAEAKFPQMTPQIKASLVAMKNNQWSALEKALGSDGLDYIKSAMAQGKTLDKEEISNHLNDHLLEKSGSILLSAVSLTASIAGIVASGGSLALAVSILWLTSATGSLGMDTWALSQAKHEASEDLDHKILLVVSGVVMTSALIAATFFSAGIAPMVGIGVVALLYGATIMYERYLAPTPQELTYGAYESLAVRDYSPEQL
ncbi:MAG: hypothetical protein KFB95_08200 [Simkaniaceae bacterium]|nr:MAG: hypothetical protein KFB95_08200 [Simkaniaceae bacterium]